MTEGTIARRSASNSVLQCVVYSRKHFCTIALLLASSVSESNIVLADNFRTDVAAGELFRGLSIASETFWLLVALLMFFHFCSIMEEN